MSKPNYNIQIGIGRAKYIVNFHDGHKKHKDGSDFYDIRIFSNLKDLERFERALRANIFTRK